MPVNKKQLLRMIRFVAEMRKNAYPNASTFARKLREMDLNENLNISCSERTIMRDLDALRKDFDAPISFSTENNGYFLTNQYWELKVPFMDDEMVMSAMLGAQLAEKIMPSPVREQIRDAVDNSIADNNSELLDRTYIETLLIASCGKTTIPPEIFGTVFQAWRERHVLHLIYQKGSTGEVSERNFEPHIVAYHKGNWYVKGVNLADGKVIVLAIFRIQKAEITRYTFEIRKDILKQTEKEGLFDYPKIENIRVKCAPEIAYYLYEQRKAKKLAITPQEDGSLIVILPPSPEQEAVRWILGEGGNVEVLEPQWLREKIFTLAQKTAEINRV
ncbi:MAG: WYL domain-containing protein [Lentisphaeria bacterium]|nr:WYL domain-containing protein [Lentisphaeria bacterium]